MLRRRARPSCRCGGGTKRCTRSWHRGSGPLSARRSRVISCTRPLTCTLPLHAAHSMPHTACYTQHAAHSMVHTTCCTLHATSCAPMIQCHASHATRCTPHAHNPMPAAEPRRPPCTRYVPEGWWHGTLNEGIPASLSVAAQRRTPVTASYSPHAMAGWRLPWLY